MEVAGAALDALGTKDLEGGRSMNGRIGVAEGPFIRRDLAVWMKAVFAQQSLNLILGEIDVDEGQRTAMKGEVPGGKPRIFPAVGHRDDGARLEVLPMAVAAAEAAAGCRELVALEPALDVVVEELLAPDHAGERLPH